jgi:4-amino-4-deoxy-L-arabinose transferase-like glycosyltransferase
MSAAAPPPGGAPVRAARDWRFWALLGLVALLLGLPLAFPRLDADQAVTGLMGAYVLRGELPVFFWMQDHAGVPEVYVAAPLFFLFGVSRWALVLAPALATVALVLAVYRTGRVLFGHEAGLLAMLFTIWVSAYTAANYTLARSYYVEHLLVGQLVLLGAALWLARPLSEPARCRVAIAMGLAGGLGLYFNFQIVDALIPAALALLLVEPRLPLQRAAWLGIGAFVLGSLPFWAYNLTHDWATFSTGVRYQGQVPGIGATRILFLERLPVLLGVQASGSDSPHLPGVLAWTIPVILGAAVALLLGRVLAGVGRLRSDPGRAGEALLLVAIAVTLGVVWYGGYVRVPRYLLPLVPFLALVLARAAQLTWRWSRVGAVAAVTLYLAAVGVDLLRDITALWPEARRQYRQEREADRRLLDFLRTNDLRRAYAFTYWVAPRLTFDSGGDVIVAQPFDDRYPPHTRAVDASPRPAYVVQGGREYFRHWLDTASIGARETRAGDFWVFDQFTPPPDVSPVPRSGWAVRAGDGRGDASSLVDARLDTGWSSAAGPKGSAWVEMDLGAMRTLSGVVLINDRAERAPEHLLVMIDAGRGWQQVAQLLPLAVATRWENGAPRVTPSRTLTVRFAPVPARRVRLVDAGSGGRWSVAELFLVGPSPPGASSEAAAVLGREGRQLETTGHAAAALLRYRDAMRVAPDDPIGYEAYARLTTALRAKTRSPVGYAARLAEVGLVEEARAAYGDIARGFAPERVHAELWRLRARLAAADGDVPEAARLTAEADASLAPPTAIGAVLGGVVELQGYGIEPQPLRAGEAVDLTTHWRVLSDTASPLMVWVHFRAVGQPEGPETHFADDFPLPGLLSELGSGPQHVSVRRRLSVPPNLAPGRYRVLIGVWNPGSGWRLHRWWRGLVPTFETTLGLSRVEIVRRGP